MAHISVSTAAEIAHQLSETINQNINVMNTDGIIIASSDPARIGELHAGAKKIIDEQLDYLIVENDTSFAGAKSGVNLPIEFEGELVGAIGITGPVGEVMQYGKIIQRMTEILLLDTKIKEQRVIEQKARDRFYDEWVIGSLEQKNEAEFLRMADSFSIDPQSPVRIAVLTFVGKDRLSDNAMTEISRHVRNSIRKKLGGNAFRTATHMVCVLDVEYESGIREVLTDLFRYVGTNYRCSCYAGLDEKACTYSLHANYEEALKALELAQQNQVSILTFDPLSLDFLIGNIPADAKSRFMQKLFPGLADDEIAAHLDFAKAYLEEDGSLITLSERLFIHKNTVKYKVNKLREVTGVDIRTCYGAYLFTLALNLSN